MLIRTLSVALIGAFLTVACEVAAQSATAPGVPANLGFEQRDSTGKPVGWMGAGGRGYQLIVDSTLPFAGKFVLRSRWVSLDTWTEEGGGADFVALSYPLSLARGRKLHLSGYIRTEGVTAGFAGFVMIVDPTGKTKAFDNMYQRGPRGTTPWTRYDIELPVDSGATSIRFGIIHMGNGTAWFDSLTIEVVGPAMPRTIPDEALARAAAAKVAADSVVPWLASHAVRLRTVEAGNGFGDMEPLKQIVGNARVVALGEATHGTREFFQLKHRMLEFLVTEMGFTVFAIEASMPDAFAINDYVLTGKGDPARALAALTAVWNTEEVRDMIEWMRQYNRDRAHVNKVKFYGFDMQSPSLAAKITLGYLRRSDPEQAAAAEKVLAQIANPITAPEYTRMPPDQRTAAMAAVGAALTRFDDHKSEYIGKTSEGEWSVARQHATIVAQYLRMHNVAPNGSPVRDSAMAANIRWILDHEGPRAKVVVWAHNWHVNTAPHMEWDYGYGMGNHLRNNFSSEMVVFGFAFNEGSFQAIEAPPAKGRNQRPFTVAPAPYGSLDETLATAGLQIAAVDLRALPTQGAVAKWFSEPQLTRNIGARYNEQSAKQSAMANMQPVATPKSYDALLFVEKTSAARPSPNSLSGTAPVLGLPANLDFESGAPGNMPDGWNAEPIALGFESATIDDRPSNGKRAAMLSRRPENYYGARAGSLTQSIDATAYRGKHITLRMMARTDAHGVGNQAYVRLQVAKPGSVTFDNLIGAPVTSSTWRSYEIEADVPDNAGTITYGLWLIGAGRVWMDAVSIEVVSRTGGGGLRTQVIRADEHRNASACTGLAKLDCDLGPDRFALRHASK